MKKRWRLRVINTSCKLDVWVENDFIFTHTAANILTRLDAQFYPHVELIIFKETEDITVFRLATGI
jgi:hypothetical protein